MNVFKSILLFLSAFFTAFFIWSAVNLFLPKTPPLFVPDFNFHKFYRISLSDKFFPAMKTSNTPALNLNAQTLKNVKLKAVYKSDKKSFVVIEKNQKTYFLNLGENFQGYKLIKIFPNEAVFEKNGKKYKVSFEKIKTYKTFSKNNSEPIIIKRQTFEYYKTHLSEIWKNIGIIKTPEGYKVTFVKPGSIFAKIGLKRGDIILEVNDIPLKKDADAWKAYNTIQNYPEVKVLIKRNFKTKVLRYEME